MPLTGSLAVIVAPRVIPCRFRERPNKYLVVAELETGEMVHAHLPDPGRLKELLVPGTRGWLVPVPHNGHRKTGFDMVAVQHGDLIVSVDTRVPNRYVHGLLEDGWLFPFAFDTIKREFTHGHSRFDFLATRGDEKYLIEVKSVTLVENGVALFPDAPTTRGTRHLDGLAASITDGFTPVAVFAIQRPDATSFRPNRIMDPAFAGALDLARTAGVAITVFSSRTCIDGTGALVMEPLARVPVAPVGD